MTTGRKPHRKAGKESLETPARLSSAEAGSADKQKNQPSDPPVPPFDPAVWDLIVA